MKTKSPAIRQHFLFLVKSPVAAFPACNRAFRSYSDTETLRSLLPQTVPAFNTGLNFLYTRSVTKETLNPFNRFKGATAKITNVFTLVMLPLIFVPISTMASSGIPYKTENAGRRYTALNMVPNTVMISVPIPDAMIAFFLVLWNM